MAKRLVFDCVHARVEAFGFDLRPLPYRDGYSTDEQCEHANQKHPKAHSYIGITADGPFVEAATAEPPSQAATV